jgi:hypothetical protein
VQEKTDFLSRDYHVSGAFGTSASTKRLHKRKYEIFVDVFPRYKNLDLRASCSETCVFQPDGRNTDKEVEYFSLKKLTRSLRPTLRSLRPTRNTFVLPLGLVLRPCRSLVLNQTSPSPRNDQRLRTHCVPKIDVDSENGNLSSHVDHFGPRKINT